MSATVSMTINGHAMVVNVGISVAAAIAMCNENGGAVTRRSVSGQERAPLCGMGVCMECRVSINGQAHSLACQTLCADGMQVETAR